MTAEQDSLHANLGGGRSVRITGQQTITIVVSIAAVFGLLAIVYMHEKRMDKKLEDMKLLHGQIYNGYIANTVTLSQIAERGVKTDEKIERLSNMVMEHRLDIIRAGRYQDRRSKRGEQAYQSLPGEPE